jgi:hypothetical protein
MTEGESGASSEQAVQAVVSRNRVALVIANNEYDSLTALSNSENGGKEMRDALEDRGFTDTDLLVNSTAEEMTDAIRAFVQRVKDLKPCDSFFYFSGHGMEQEGRSYLMPIDYTIPGMAVEAAVDLAKELEAAVDLEAHLFSKLNEACCPDAMHIVMLDCCREDEENTVYRNAFGSSCIGSGGGNHECYRSAEHCAPDSSQFIVAFGTAPGTETIEFQQDKFGLFTGEFLEVLKESNGSREEFHEIFRQVTKRVSDESMGRLEPWYNAGGLKRRFYFREQLATQVSSKASSFKCLMYAFVVLEFYSPDKAKANGQAPRESGKKTVCFGYFQFQHPRRN